MEVREKYEITHIYTHTHNSTHTHPHTQQHTLHSLQLHTVLWKYMLLSLIVLFLHLEMGVEDNPSKGAHHPQQLTDTHIISKEHKPSNESDAKLAVSNHVVALCSTGGTQHQGALFQ